MTSRFSSYALFSPAWWLVLVVTLAMCALTFRLGLWQLGRAHYKEQQHEQQMQQRQRPPLRNADVLQTGEGDAAWLQRAVDLQGEWLEPYTVFLANRSMGARVGFWVLTPLRLQGKTAVLVVRGWAPRDLTYSDKLPAIETPTGAVSVRGHWVPAPSHMMELAAAQTQTSKGFVPLRQNIDVSDFARESGLHVLGTVQQTGDPSEGLWRDWPTILTGADKNRAYALQWFALSALCAGLFIWFQIIQKRRHG